MIEFNTNEHIAKILLKERKYGMLIAAGICAQFSEVGNDQFHHFAKTIEKEILTKAEELEKSIND